MISENLDSRNRNSSSFALGSRSSSPNRYPETSTVAANSFRINQASQKPTKRGIPKSVTRVTISPSQKDLEYLNYARECVVYGDFDTAEKAAFEISDRSTQELFFVELAEALFKNEEFQKAEAVARRISSPREWERILSIFLEFKPTVPNPKKPITGPPRQVFGRLERPPGLTGKDGSFGSIKILRDYSVLPPNRHPF